MDLVINSVASLIQKWTKEAVLEMSGKDGKCLHCLHHHFSPDPVTVLIQVRAALIHFLVERTHSSGQVVMLLLTTSAWQIMHDVGSVYEAYFSAVLSKR